jgi:hypothetical protein
MPARAHPEASRGYGVQFGQGICHCQEPLPGAPLCPHLENDHGSRYRAEEEQDHEGLNHPVIVCGSIISGFVNLQFRITSKEMAVIPSHLQVQDIDTRVGREAAHPVAASVHIVAAADQFVPSAREGPLQSDAARPTVLHGNKCVDFVGGIDVDTKGRGRRC